MKGLRWGALLILLSACPSSKPAPAVSCIDGDARCGAACSEAKPCDSGLYCTAEGTCAKQCLAAEAASCSDGAQCSAQGKCVDATTGGTGPGGSGSAGRDGAGGSTAQAGRGGQGGRGDPPCAQTKVSAMRVQPTVILIVDQSGSMTEAFGSGTRWNVLRDSLLKKPGGLINALQGQVKFGLALYSADSSPENDQNGPPMVVGTCPAVHKVAAALNNYDAISKVYAAEEPLDDTPTGDSINAVLDSLKLDKNPSTDANPIVFVVATDGVPDRCENLDPSGAGDQALARMESVAAVTRAFQNHIRTYMISVGAEVSASHMAEMANAGLGRAAGEPPAEYWEPTNDASLRDALTKIIGAEVSCDIELMGEVQGEDHCLGDVELNGKRLACDGADGWELTDSKHIRLLGSACSQLKNDAEATLDVSFPCQVKIFVPQ